MQKRIGSLPFTGTPEQEAQLREAIARHKDEKGALMPVLQEAQEIYGYLPIEVQQIISQDMGIPMEEIFGVATFYSQFALTPKGQYKISVCLGTACYVKGSGKLMEKLEELLKIKPGEISNDLQFSLDATRCIGACGLAPVLTIGEDVYGRLEPNQLEGILAKYR